MNIMKPKKATKMTLVTTVSTETHALLLAAIKQIEKDTGIAVTVAQYIRKIVLEHFE